MRKALVLSWLAATPLCRAAFELSYGDDSDLTDFVTRPDIKAPLLEVEQHHLMSIAPGYIFVAPYAQVYQEKAPEKYWEPCQTGPHIYDSDGELVWSGACVNKNKNVADFRPIYYDGQWYLSGVRQAALRDVYDSTKTSGHGFVINSSYAAQSMIDSAKDVPSFNMHEFQIVDDGRSALSVIHKPVYRDLSHLSNHQQHAGAEFQGGWIENNGFREVDLADGSIKFEWWALDHVDVTESAAETENLDGPPPETWNYFYITSIDKSSSGDYLISARNTDAVYLVSGTSGKILWQLGGKSSSFKIKGFSFTRQHDARFLDADVLPFKAKKGFQYISIFDNGVGVDGEPEEDDESEGQKAADRAQPISSVLIVALDVSAMKAELVHRIERPDEYATLFGGNSHLLSNGNVFVSWAGDGYMTEHDVKRGLVMEARFATDRFTTYRAYKSEFKAVVLEPPLLKCYAYGTSERSATTACFVSQNGATEVREWRFVEQSGDVGDGETIGVVSKNGFETKVQIQGFVESIYAEGLDASGAVLGTSEPVKVIIAKSWDSGENHREL